MKSEADLLKKIKIELTWNEAEDILSDFLEISMKYEIEGKSDRIHKPIRKLMAILDKYICPL